MPKTYKLVVYVPLNDADRIRQVLADSGAGKIGNYDSASFTTSGTGRFRPLKGANPAIGSVGQVNQVAEERIETVVDESDLNDVVARVKKEHPYEEPVIDIYELFN